MPEHGNKKYVSRKCGLNHEHSGKSIKNAAIGFSENDPYPLWSDRRSKKTLKSSTKMERKFGFQESFKASLIHHGMNKLSRSIQDGPFLNQCRRLRHLERRQLLFDAEGLQDLQLGKSFLQ